MPLSVGLAAPGILDAMTSRPLSLASLAVVALVVAGCSPAAPGGGVSGGAGGSTTPGAASSSGETPGAPGSPGPSAEASTVAPGAHATPSTGGVRYTPTGSGRLDGKVIVLDPGHNGGKWIQSINNARKPMFGTEGQRCQAIGATAADKKTTESSINWAIAQKVLPQLLQAGATVILTRPDNEGVGPCNDERAAMANAANADFLMSIHADGVENQTPRGFFTLVPGHSAGGQALIDADKAAAAKIVAAVKAHSQIPPSNYLGKDEGWVHQEDMATLNNLTKTRGVLLEIGNIFQNQDWAIVNSDAGKQSLADGIVAGVTDAVAG